jgi:hypothetical protein
MQLKAIVEALFSGADQEGQIRFQGGEGGNYTHPIIYLNKAICLVVFEMAKKIDRLLGISCTRYN